MEGIRERERGRYVGRIGSRGRLYDVTVSNYYIQFC